MSEEQKKMFLFVVLSGVILFGWQYFFAAPKSSNPVSPTVQTVTPSEAEVAKAPLIEEKTQPLLNAPLVVYELKNAGHSFFINNLGEITKAINTEEKFDFESIVGSPNPFQIMLGTATGYEAVSFEIQQVSEKEIKLVNSAKNLSILFSLDEKGKLSYQFTSADAVKFVFVFNSTPKKLENNQLRHFAILSNKLKKIEVKDAEVMDDTFHWAGIDFHYHLFVMDFAEKQNVHVETTEQGKMIIKLNEAKTSFSGFFVFTKKDYDKLSSLGHNLNLSVDFGLFSVIAVPILRALQFFYKMIPNYGVAIILLTILIRLLTFPLQYKSFKSMKKMQEIQPELKKIKEKFKDNPQRVQQETMQLFKKAGANPISGCLPLLLQLPIFFAFYRMLSEAVELVGAPFIFWIHDLSIKDPIYILPVLMGISMFLQQKFTPSPSADPIQKKMMMFLPLIFTFIMKDLPAGLNLYIFVSTMLGIAQQMYVFKSKSA